MISLSSFLSFWSFPSFFGSIHHFSRTAPLYRQTIDAASRQTRIAQVQALSQSDFRSPPPPRRTVAFARHCQAASRRLFPEIDAGAKPIVTVEAGLPLIQAKPGRRSIHARTACCNRDSRRRFAAARERARTPCRNPSHLIRKRTMRFSSRDKTGAAPGAGFVSKLACCCTGSTALLRRTDEVHEFHAVK